MSKKSPYQPTGLPRVPARHPHAPPSVPSWSHPSAYKPMGLHRIPHKRPPGAK